MTEKSKEPKPPKKKKEIVIVPHPSEDEDISGEMSEMFEEEEVKHQHGRTEPEAD